MTPITAPPPHMSNFMSSILSPGFSEMPPESNVRPLPTTATVSTLPFTPFGSHVITISFGGCADPRATPSSEPMPRAAMSARSSTRTSTPCCLPIATAQSAR